MRFYPDHQSLLPAYDLKEIDGISRIWPSEMSGAARRSDLQIFSAPLSGYTVIYLNLANPNVAFLQDKAVRQALIYALDRQGLIDSVLQGQGIVAHSPMLPGTWRTIRPSSGTPTIPKRRNAFWTRQAGGADGDGVREKDGKKLAFILVGDINRCSTPSPVPGGRSVYRRSSASHPAGLTTDFLAPRSFDAAVVQGN